MPVVAFEARFSKFNRSKIPEFNSPQAEHNFLYPLGLTINELADNQCCEETETNFFKAIHFVKYKIYCGLTKESPVVDKTSNLYKIYVHLRNKIAEANVGLVYSCLQKTNVNTEPETLISEGFIALLRAVDNFDPWKGHRFSTYACTSVLHNFINTIYASKLVPMAEIDSLPLFPEEKEPLIIDRIKKILKNRGPLTEREYDILDSKFTLENYKEKATLKEIGKKYGLTKERIRQIEKIALRKLKTAIMADRTWQ